MESERALYLFIFRIGLSENRFTLFGPMLWTPLKTPPATGAHEGKSTAGFPLLLFRIGLSEKRKHFPVRCSGFARRLRNEGRLKRTLLLS
jgi:hypothetical protein